MDECEHYIFKNPSRKWTFTKEYICFRIKQYDDQTKMGYKLVHYVQLFSTVWKNITALENLVKINNVCLFYYMFNHLISYYFHLTIQLISWITHIWWSLLFYYSSIIALKYYILTDIFIKHYVVIEGRKWLWKYDLVSFNCDLWWDVYRWFSFRPNGKELNELKLGVKLNFSKCLMLKSINICLDSGFTAIN